MPPPIPPRALARSSGVVAAVQPQATLARSSGVIAAVQPQATIARSSGVVPAVQPEALEREPAGSEDSVDIDLTPAFAKREVTPLPIVAATSASADPTPLPRPAVERESDAWLAAQLGTATSSGWDGTAHVARTATQVPILRLALVAVLFGGLSAMTVILLRGDRTPNRARAAAVVSTPAATVDSPAVEPPAPAVPVETPTLSVEPLPAPEAAQETITPPVADESQMAAAEPAPAAPTPPAIGEQSPVAEPPVAEQPVAESQPVAEQPQVAEPPPVVAAAPEAPKTTERDKKKRRHGKRPARSARKGAARSEKTVAAASVQAGEGTLMISSKPPCEIAIDGVATVLTTPQRAIKLRAGKHKVTLFNLEHKIDKTFDVTIKSGKATKLIHDFMKKK